MRPVLNLSGQWDTTGGLVTLPYTLRASSTNLYLCLLATQLLAYFQSFLSTRHVTHTSRTHTVLSTTSYSVTLESDPLFGCGACPSVLGTGDGSSRLLLSLCCGNKTSWFSGWYSCFVFRRSRVRFWARKNVC
jgi:hypothetical protein